MKRLARFVGSGTIAAMLLAWTPDVARAEDDTEQTSLLAFLGLTAADGKTTLGDGAGSVEASLLNSDAVNEAGGIIAGLVNGYLNESRSVLVLAHDGSVSLSSLRAVRSRIDNLDRRISGVACPALDSRRHRPAPRRPQLEFSAEATQLRDLFAASDVVGALATTTNYAAVDAPVEDRLLLNSLMVNAGLRLELDGERARPAVWTHPQWRRPGRDGVTFVFPAEAQADPDNGLFAAYLNMVRHAEDRRRCIDRPEVKAAIDVIDAYVTELNAVSDDRPVSQLAAAAQLDAAAPEGTHASILRVAVERAGGTTATRSSIWYTLGFPGAATVSAGLLVSFRLIDADTGAPTFAGVVRCATRPRNIRSVARVVQEGEPPNRSPQGSRLQNSGCTYIAGAARRS